ncbi:MAG: type VI secretion system baseplate subunit TssF [Gemmatimonadaceae bacterium]|jgi:type VI secretion system protein ImpG|nr:type VI secretion system baseplate subunit TssF [Gemmatimonadaceae bacterium]
MRDDVLEYYERELAYLRRSGSEFARQYPKVAARLQLEPTRCEDPHVERLLEGLAFLTARVHKRIDDDVPEIAQALLDLVHPNATRPLPSMALVALQPDVEQGQLLSGYAVPRGTALYTRASHGVTCRFRTCADVTLWPITVQAVEWLPADRIPGPSRGDARTGAVRVVLETGVPGLTFSRLPLDRLRLHFTGDPRVAATLYELVHARCVRVLVNDATAIDPVYHVLERSRFSPIGFGADETMLPTTRRALVGYELLRDYFALPEKFFGVDVSGLDLVAREAMGTRVALTFVIDRLPREEWRTLLERELRAEHVALGCTPIVNLFPQASEPIVVTPQRLSFRVVPDTYQREHLEVFSVDEVVAVEPSQQTPRRFRPLHLHRHGELAPQGDESYWLASRRHAPLRPMGGGDVWLTFADRDARPVRPSAAALTARLTCTNGDLPHRLELLGDGRDFLVSGGAPIAGIRALVLPTAPAPAAARGAHLWRLASALSLAHVSLIDDGPAALRALLEMHVHRPSAAASQQVGALLGVESHAAHARIAQGLDVGYVRGRRVTLDLDESAFTGASAYLFAAVLERFLGLYVSVNSFTQVTATARGRTQPLAAWPPRAGWKPLA